MLITVIGGLAIALGGCSVDAPLGLACRVDADCPPGQACRGDRCDRPAAPVDATSPDSSVADARVPDAAPSDAAGSDASDATAPTSDAGCETPNDCVVDATCHVAECNAGQCLAVARPDGTPCVGMESGRCCGGVCMDVTSDVDNCGGCGNRCAAGGPECRIPSCVTGACSYAFHVGDGSLCSSGICCNGSCVNDQSDGANCGGCGTTCTPPYLCNVGRCGCVTAADCPNGASFNTCDGRCFCQFNGACAMGQMCFAGTCRYP